ncbi:hypothetical protein TNCV_3778481 [Trichonephila clavipes]|nr:hypothetical protein TNCV_3778481 [Trichonephila clavipes]
MQIYQKTPMCFLCIFEIAVVPFQQQRVCDILLLQKFLYLFQTPCKSPAEDAKLGTAQVSQQSVEVLDTQNAVDAYHGTILVSHQLFEMPDIERFFDTVLGTAL